MQKKLIVLAIAAMASTSAFADTTLYGVLDVGYANAAKTALGATAATSLKTGEAAFAYSTLSSSRLGVLSSEDMGDGLKATVKAETSIGSNQMSGFGTTSTATPTNNGTTLDLTVLGSRELWVALSTASGTTIQAGYGSTLIRDITLAYSADFGGNLVGNAMTNDSLLGSNRVVGATVSQSFGAITGTVQLTTNTDSKDGATNTQNGNGYLLGLLYADGPLSLGVALQSVKTVDALAAPATVSTAANLTISSITGLPVTATSDAQRDITVLGGSYDLGVAKLFAEFATIKNTDNITATKTTKKTYESIGVDVPFTSAITGFVQLTAGTNDSSASATGASVNVSGYNLGGKYFLSKTTYAYLSVGELKLAEGTTATGADVIGAKTDQYTIGLVKAF
jgi:predicted porin